MNTLYTNTLSNQNIAAYLEVGSYTAVADCQVMIRVVLDQVAGNGDYFAYATIDSAVFGPITKFAVPNAVTKIGFVAGVQVPLLTGEVLKVYVKGLAADTTTVDIVTKVFDLAFSTLSQANILSDATPFAGANIANLDELISSRAAPGAEMDLVDAPNATAITAIQNGLSTLEQADILSDAIPFAGANIDAAISTRSTLTAAQVWANTVRSLTTFGTLVAEMWAYVRRTLTSSGTAEEETEGTGLTVTRGVTYDHTLTGLTVPATWETLYLTAKRDLDDDDEDALVQLMVSNPADATADGLIVLNGDDDSTLLSKGSLTVDAVNGTVRVQLLDEATLLLPVSKKATYDLKWLLSGGSSQKPWASASFVAQATETQAVS